MLRETTMATILRSLALAAGAFALGCGGDDGAGSPDAGPVLDAGPGDFHADRAGYVNVVEGGVFLGVFAAIADGPERPIPTVIAIAGDCAVYRRPAPALCTPSCDGVCESGTCHPWPRTVDVGRITVTGLRQPLAFVPGEFGYEPTPAPPQDLFDAGATITIAAPGATIPGFSATFTGPAPLLGATQSLTLRDGEPATITWTAAGSGEIQVALLVGWHGAPWEAMLLCETDDDGELIIPGALVSALPEASSGLESHTSTVTRFARANVLGPHGPIELLVGSQRPIYVTRSTAR